MSGFVLCKRKHIVNKDVVERRNLKRCPTCNSEFEKTADLSSIVIIDGKMMPLRKVPRYVKEEWGEEI